MKIYQVDAFTNIEFKGNPAAICILEKDYDDSVLQNIAMEMNLSRLITIIHGMASMDVYEGKELNVKYRKIYKNLYMVTKQNGIMYDGARISDII